MVDDDDLGADDNRPRGIKNNTSDGRIRGLRDCCGSKEEQTSYEKDKCRLEHSVSPAARGFEYTYPVYAGESTFVPSLYHEQTTRNFLKRGRKKLRVVRVD